MAEKKAADSKKPDDTKKDETPTALVESEGKHDGNPQPGEGAKSATSNASPAEADKPAPRAHADTIGMPFDATVGAPPALPQAGGVEDPTNMPAPKNIPTGDPSTPAAAPGHVPAGDSRSLRKPGEFALIYRRQTHVITRTGAIGTQGTWRVVEYPTVVMASTSYARECSKFVGDGFSDYR